MPQLDLASNGFDRLSFRIIRVDAGCPVEDREDGANGFTPSDDLRCKANRLRDRVGSDDQDDKDFDDLGEGGSTGADKMSTVPEDESLGGIEGKLGQAKKKAGCLAPTETATLGNSKLMVKERDDLILCVEGCHGADVAHTLPSNHARLRMGFCRVPCKPLQRELLTTSREITVRIHGGCKQWHDFIILK